MQTNAAPYFRLLDLALQWSRQSRAPPEMVLRSLCEWAVAGGFPAESLVDTTGTVISGLDIYMSFRASIESGITLGGTTYHPAAEQWSHQVLSKVQVSRQGVLTFCDRTATLPPAPVLNRFLRTWTKFTSKRSSAPPLCPDAAEHTQRALSRRNASDFLASLHAMLSGLKGGHRRIGRTVPDEPIDFEFWGPRWQKQVEAARGQIALCDDPSLLPRLESLESEWSAFVALKSGAATSEPSQPTIQDGAGAGSAFRRSAGRPLGSGSYEEADAPFVEEIREAVLADSTLSPTAAAMRIVDRLPGAGTPDSKAKRIVERYSKKYRPQSANHTAE